MDKPNKLYLYVNLAGNPTNLDTIPSVNVYDKNIFLLENHIQGNAKSLVRYGLYYNNDLVSLITYTKSRYKKLYPFIQRKKQDLQNVEATFPSIIKNLF